MNKKTVYALLLAVTSLAVAGCSSKQADVPVTRQELQKDNQKKAQEYQNKYQQQYGGGRR